VLAGERSVTSCTKLKLLTGRSHLLYKTIHHIAQMLETFSKHLNKVCAECKKKKYSSFISSLNPVFGYMTFNVQYPLAMISMFMLSTKTNPSPKLFLFSKSKIQAHCPTCPKQVQTFCCRPFPSQWCSRQERSRSCPHASRLRSGDWRNTSSTGSWCRLLTLVAAYDADRHSISRKAQQHCWHYLRRNGQSTAGTLDSLI